MAMPHEIADYGVIGDYLNYSKIDDSIKDFKS